MSEYDYEPVRGLPYQLPEDEKILWQGSPQWRSLAVHICHVRTITLYFAVLIAWRFLVPVLDGKPVSDAYELAAFLALLNGIVVGMAVIWSILLAKTTIYTITTRRVVLRYGIALTKAVNVPLRLVKNVGMNRHSNGCADIAFETTGQGRIAYLILWPHTRPWHVSPTQPMLRSVPEAEKVAEILKQALAPFAAQSVDENESKETQAATDQQGAEKKESDLGQPAAEAA
ncbi:PH domain-containing protein [Rhodomicrobium sp. Az07]|uniref:photosynthetic complex putative assembly protein PuhB n=1 Tax=Rhodomicrobium sp. Az07 TaxID=2839034 RepID=UPI001BE978D9|nr:photosynthetic complex putative assembly protein PuhB [Rhodomicrobium sp. Az07]MBT3070354.1 PH domain-containing protein [Rhodomicrobium sp. Az07]